MIVRPKEVTAKVTAKPAVNLRKKEDPDGLEKMTSPEEPNTP